MARLRVGLRGHDPQGHALIHHLLLGVATRALDERPEVAGARDGHGASLRIDLGADGGHEQIGFVAGDDRLVEEREHGARRLAAGEVLPHHPAQARHRHGRARPVAAHVRQQRRHVAVAVLDDLEEITAVTDGAALARRDAEMAPRRQVYQLRPTACGRARVEEFGSACC